MSTDLRIALAATAAPRADRDRRERWTDQANCKGLDPDLFHPERGESTEPAKAVCRTCVVRDQCLEYALARPVQKEGIWGGLSENERRRLRRQRAQVRRRLDGAA